MKRRIMGAALIALSVASLSYGRELDLEGALELAATGNPDIRIKELEGRKKELQVSKDKKAFLPVVSARTMYLPKENNDGDDGWAPTFVGASLPLYTGGVRRANLAKSRIDEEIQEREMEILDLDIKEQVVFQYFDILNTKKNIEVNKTLIETLNKQRERLSGLYEGGRLIPKSELLKVESDILKAEAELYTFEQTLEVEKYNLKILLGLEMGEKLTLSAYDYQGVDLSVYEIESNVNTALALGNRADIERLKVERAEQDVKIARAEFLPKINASAAYIADEGYEDYDEDYVATISATWKLFDWGSNFDNLNQSKIGLEQAEIESKKGLDTVEVELRAEYANMNSLYILTESEEKNLAIRKENLRIDTMRYDSGIIGSFEYLDSVTKLSQAESEFFRLQRDLVLSEIRYQDLLK